MLLHTVKDQIEVIVVAVGWHRALLNGVLALVHLEGCGKVLGTLHHRDRNLTHKDTTLDIMLLLKLQELGTYLLWRSPLVSDDKRRQTLALHSLLVERKLGTALLIGSVIHDYGKRTVALNRRSLHLLCLGNREGRQGKQCRNK